MKRSTFLPLLTLAALVGCSDSKIVAIKDFVPGTYSRSVQNEFSEGHDTLVITDLGNKAYGIEHRMTYRRISEGKRLPEERKLEKWTAFFNEETAALQEAKRGRTLTFQPERNILLVGGSEYKKIL